MNHFLFLNYFNQIYNMFYFLLYEVYTTISDQEYK